MLRHHGIYSNVGLGKREKAEKNDVHTDRQGSWTRHVTAGCNALSFRSITALLSHKSDILRSDTSIKVRLIIIKSGSTGSGLNLTVATDCGKASNFYLSCHCNPKFLYEPPRRSWSIMLAIHLTLHCRYPRCGSSCPTEWVSIVGGNKPFSVIS